MTEQQPGQTFCLAPETQMKEFTVKSIVMGGIFSVIFGAATVWLP